MNIVTDVRHYYLVIYSSVMIEYKNMHSILYFEKKKTYFPMQKTLLKPL